MEGPRRLGSEEARDGSLLWAGEWRAVALPTLRIVVRTDRDEQVLESGTVTEVDGDVEQAWLPVECGGCGEIVMVAGEQRGMRDREMTATAHRGTCPDCGQRIEVRVEYMQERFDRWQPLANPEVEGGEAVEVDDVV